MVYDPRNSNVKYDPKTSYKNPRNTVMPNALPNTLNTIPNNLPSGLPTQVGSPYPYYWKSTHYQPKQYPDLVSNYNDPYALNSMADVISASFNDKMDNANIVNKGPLQVLNIIPNTLKMINDTTVKPIAQGEFGKAAINNLMALSETLDIVANPVKGYLMEGSEGFVKGLGFSDQGRTNYDWNTGNVVKDIGLELISDPLNWLTLFTKPIISGVTKASVKSVLKEGGAQAGKQLDDIVAYAVRSYVWGDKPSLINSLSDIGKAIGRQADDTFVKSFETAMEYLLKNAEHYTNLNIIKGTMSLVKAADKLDDAILKASLKTTPATGGLWLAKKGFEPVFEYFNSVSFKIAKKYETPTGHIDFMKLNEYEKEAMQFEMPFSSMVKKMYGLDFVPQELRDKKIRGSLLEEASKFWSFYKTLQAEKYPDILPEYKVNKIKRFLEDNFGGDYETFLKVLHDYNEANPDTFQLLEQVIADGLNIDLQKFNFNYYVDKNKAQAMYDYISKNLFKDRDIQISTKFTLLNEYTFREHGVYLHDYIKYLEELNIKHEGKFEYIYKVLKNIQDEYQETMQIELDIANKLALYKKNEMLIPKIDAMVRQLDAAKNMLHPRLKQIVEKRQLDNLTKTQVTQVRRSLKEDLDVIMSNLEKMFNTYSDSSFPFYDEVINKVMSDLRNYSNKLVNAVHIKGFDYKVYANFDTGFRTLIDDSVDVINKMRSDLQKYTWDNARQTLESSIKDTSKIFKDQGELIYNKLKEKMKQVNKTLPSQSTYNEFAYSLQGVYDNFVKNVVGTKTNFNAEAVADKMRKLLHYQYDDAGKMVVELEDFNESFNELYSTVSYYMSQIQAIIEARATKNIGHTYTTDLNNLKEIMNVLNRHIDTTAPKLTAAINVLDDIQYYRLQIEKMYPTELAISDKNFNKILDEILTPNTELYNFFHNLALEGDERAVHALEGFYHFKNYKDFRISLAEAQISPEVKTSFLSSLQKYAKTDAREVNKHLNKYIYRLFQDTEQHYNSIMMKRRLKVETLFDEYIRNDDELFKQYANDLLTLGLDDSSHNAMVDSVRLKYITNAALDKALPETPDVIRLFADIETTGTNKYIDDVTQLAIFSGNPQDAFMQNIATEIKPLSSTIRAITGAKETGRKSLLSLYEFTFQRLATNEDKAFVNMIQYLENQIATGKQVQMFMHNGDRFDVPFFKEKLTRMVAVAHDTNSAAIEAIEELYNRGMSVLSKVNIIDTYKEMCKLDNYSVLDNTTKRQLTVMLKSLAEKQAIFHFDKTPSYVPYLVQPLNSSIGKRFIELADMLNKQTYATTRSIKERVTKGAAIKGFKKTALGNDLNLATQLKLAGADIQQFFISIKQANKKYAGQYIDKTLFQSQEFLDEFRALNLSQLLYSAIDPDTGERVFINGVRHYGYKNAINTEAIREFFDINRHVTAGVNKLSYGEAERYTLYAKYIQNYVDRIENGRILELNADRINKLTKQILDHIHLAESVPIYLQRLKPHDSFVYNYAILQFLYHRPEDLLKNFWEEGLTKVINPKDMDLIELVKNPLEWTRQTKYSDRTISFIEDSKATIQLEKRGFNSKDLISLIENVEIKDTLDDRIEKMQKLLDKFDKKINALDDIAQIEAMHQVVDEAVERMKYDINYLKSVSKGFDENSIHRAYQQKKIAELNKIYDSLTNYRSILFDEPTLAGKEKIYDNMKAYTNKRALLELHQIINLSNKDLFNHLATNAKRLITFNTDDFKNNKMFIEDLSNLLSRKSELSEMGIDVNVETITYSGYTLRDEITPEVKTMQQVYITLNKDIELNYIDGKVYSKEGLIASPVIKEYEVEDLIDGLELSEKELKFYLEDMENARQQLINLSEGKIVGGLGEIANQTYYKEVYNYLPDKIKKLLPDVEVTINKHTVDAATFNHSVLGSPFNRQRVASAMPNDVLSVYANSAKYLADWTSTINEYLQLYYDDIYSINIGIMKDMTDTELFETIKNAEGFTLAFLKDVKGKPLPTKINLTSPSLVKEARRLGAVIVPTQTFNKSFEVIQNFKWSESQFNFWHKIIYTYKTGFLTNAGVLMRNMVDSTMKNMISTGDPLGILRSYGEGMKTYIDYITVMDDILKAFGNTKQESVEMYFKNMNPPMSLDMFALLRGFMEDGPAAGEIPVLAKYFDKNKDNTLWTKYVHLSSKLLSPNTEFEHIARLSEYLWAIKHGYTNSAAYDLVTKTHFDYGLKTKSQLMTELVFPFYTFKMRNLEYWIDAIEADPKLLSLFRDIMTPIWNFDSYNEDELERNRSLQYQILSGNLPLHGIINSLPKEMTLKLNPSFMDVYNTLTDPLGTTQSSLAPPFRSAMNYATKGLDDSNFFAKTLGNQAPSFFTEQGVGTDTIGLIPFVGAMYQRYAEQGPKYFERTGNILNKVLPDIFGATQRRTPFPQTKPRTAVKKGYTPRTYTLKAHGGKRLKARKASIYTKRTPRGSKPEKYYPQNSKVYHKNFYHKNNYNGDNIYKKLYTAKGASKLKTAMTPVTPTTLKYKLRMMHNYFR